MGFKSARVCTVDQLEQIRSLILIPIHTNFLVRVNTTMLLCKYLSELIGSSLNRLPDTKERHLSNKRRARSNSFAQPNQLTRQSRYQSPDLTVVNEEYFSKPRRRVELVPKTLNQESYIDLLTDPSKLIVFATGPAGTGKTMLAVMAAIQAYQDGRCKKIIITRPAVGCDGEDLGFLPGDINEKMAPWIRPVIDVFAEYYRQQDITRMLDEQTIEISPLAYMRGRSLKDAWIIADEIQNASPSQLRMLLTRLGENSKMVVTGDLRQADRKDSDNGLLDFSQLFEQYGKSRYIAGIEFSGRDIQRHPAVAEVLKIYGEI